MKPIHFFYLLCLLVGSVACNNDDDDVPVRTEFTGPQVEVGDGHAWSYVRTDTDGIPTAIGLQFEALALDNLPTGSPHGDEFVLPLPPEITVAPYDHITFDWIEHGHEPMMVYDLPHFDVHFYFMSMDQRNMITPFDSVEFNRPLPAEYLAPLYLETPGGVPRMGAHIIDLESPEIAGTGTFTHTFIYGKYDGQLNFLEPMVTKAFLDSRTSVDKAIKQPSDWQQTGYYPNRYTIDFDSDTGLYSILLVELEEH